ncbi:hypothetical protein C922_05436 [Plasmodium inui San Antonio 1]|uniref:Uncharacterized protein n=1 Tax=Plasmodium inui San Antonio 1 TaxID=1237626 RepID=W6ZXY7_9APIC|nr:hypothetical protein C922_05436 [Plasmodium inui San Antonio 1]EUD64183.1 hypothetical protein C922_05436 [Plasmodium inui San Antonio 1]
MTHTEGHLHDATRGKSIHIKRIEKKDIFRQVPERSIIGMPRKRDISIKRRDSQKNIFPVKWKDIDMRKCNTRKHCYNNLPDTSILKKMPPKEKESVPRQNGTHNSDMAQGRRIDREGEHHKDAGEKSIIMRRRHRKNRDKNATDRRIFIEMPGELVSSSRGSKKCHHRQTLQENSVKGMPHKSVSS